MIEAAVSNGRKKKGTVKASITRLLARVGKLETAVDQPNTLDHAQHSLIRLETLNSEYKVHHFALIDLIEDEAVLQREQENLDNHDDIISDLSVHIQRLINSCTTVTIGPDICKTSSRRLKHLQKNLSTVCDKIKELSDGSEDVCHLKQHEEQLADYKKELADLQAQLLSLDITDEDELVVEHSVLQDVLFNCSLKIKEFLLGTSTSSLSSDSSNNMGVKLPKLDVLTFDGNILNWKCFWEQFCISVHDHPSLSEAEKLVYLCRALKDGWAKHAIEGLSRSDEHYMEAIDCLKTRYDRPCLRHQARVRVILNAPTLKDGRGKELRGLHDTVQQHLRALRSMGYKPSVPSLPLGWN